MKPTLELKKISTDRSLQRRFILTDAEPVHEYLRRDRIFVPADLRIWWNAEAGQTPDQHTFRIYAWPEDRQNHVSATWQDGYNHHPLPEWIRELSDVVHEDLIANATSANSGTEDSWAYSVDRTWTIEDADTLPSLRYPHEPFVPANLDIWHSYNAKQMHSNRHTIRAFPADLEQRLRLGAHWDGGIHWDGSSRYNEDLPEWIRVLAEDQYAQLVEFATLSEQERGTR